MDHAAFHRDDDAAHLVPEAGLAQRVDAARGYGEVDGAASARANQAHVRAALEDLHWESALRQRDREQGAGETRANERYCVGAILHVVDRRVACGRIAAQAIILPDMFALPIVPGRIS